MLGLVILLAIGLAVAWSGTVLYTAWMLTHPPRRTYASAVAKGRAGDPGELAYPRHFESWNIETKDGPIELWDVVGDNPLGPVVVLVHGWGDSRIGGLARLPSIARASSRVILFDLPGHGESPGICRLGTRYEAELLAQIVNEIQSHWLRDRLHEEQGIRQTKRGSPRVVTYGWSLGAGIAILNAHCCCSPAGVIAESPYRFAITPARNVLQQQRLPYRLTLGPAIALLNLRWPGRLLNRVFDRAVYAALMDGPLLVIHGELDEICPLEDGEAIAETAPKGEIVVIENGDHNSLWTGPETKSRCDAAVIDFLTKLSN